MLILHLTQPSELFELNNFCSEQEPGLWLQPSLTKVIGSHFAPLHATWLDPNLIMSQIGLGDCPPNRWTHQTLPSYIRVWKPVVSCPARKIGGKIRLVTLCTILDTRSNFHTFRQEFERANRNAAFFNHWIQKTGSVSYTYIRLLFPPLCDFNYAN